ncbi:MAG: hypothetical protein NT062_05000 [Proteobacteria bacterium]|nr:hypothetical protein [Pseudomonadota bacterium]
MNTHLRATLLLVMTCLVGCSRSSPSNVPDPVPDAEVPDGPVAIGDLSTRAAEAICGALFRCCDADLETYFGPYRENDRLAAFRDQLPPAVTLDEVGCRAVLAPMLDIAPLGDWVAAAKAGSVAYDPTAFATCITALDTATCGAPVRAALWDGTCLGFAAPVGGAEQRSMFHRTAGVGAACAPIRDGIGSMFYGTCDPASAFCCYADPAHPGCQLPFQAGGVARPGQCTSVAALGEACSPSAPIQLCATGNDCDGETGTCVAPSLEDLAIGATCINNNYTVLGVCQDSYCDLLGSKRCEPLRDDGVACTTGDECRSTHCDSVCAPVELCTNQPPAPPGDAGVPPDMPTDAPGAGSGETCATAASLISASTSSPVLGYTSRVTSAFGATNDYNPLKTSGLPPACAFAYDARGREVVYTITLAPGDRLRLRAELADGKQAGIYLLDACAPTVSWPDFDLSGACGSNEFEAGFCGPVGCDPATLDITYPLAVGGQATTDATFWVVVDQVGADDSTGFVLDWKLLQP